MSNWTKNKELMQKWGILTVDNVPKNVLSYLKDNITNISFNNELAGEMREEYQYKDWPKFIDDFILKQTITPVLDYYAKKIKILSENKPYYLNSLWVNLQKKFEFNPIHDHSGIFSFIIFLKIPYDLKKEDKVFPKTSNQLSRTSKLSFLTQDYDGEILDIVVPVDKSFIGKMLMFPAKLKHLVYPFFTSDEERITVSGNISILV